MLHICVGSSEASLLAYKISTKISRASSYVRRAPHLMYRASDFFQDCSAEVTHGAKSGESFSEMMGLSISNKHS